MLHNRTLKLSHEQIELIMDALNSRIDYIQKVANNIKLPKAANCIQKRANEFRELKNKLDLGGLDV